MLIILGFKDFLNKSNENLVNKKGALRFTFNYKSNYSTVISSIEVVIYVIAALFTIKSIFGCIYLIKFYMSYSLDKSVFMYLTFLIGIFGSIISAQ